MSPISVEDARAHLPELVAEAAAVAQAMAEQLTLVIADGKLWQYESVVRLL